MTLGPLMLDIDGLELSAEDRELLSHPLVGGVILFSRNYESVAQLEQLTAALHAIRQPSLLVAVDQEGGRVQRFKDGFTELPAALAIGRCHDMNPEEGLAFARCAGWLMAAELRAAGVDLSFAPVLDLNWGMSGVIGDRAFHREPETVAALASAYMSGMRAAGMSATGKHFPGHGAVVQDSHHTLPVDRRDYADLDEDLLPFQRLSGKGLAGVMTAHVLYSQVDDQPASFSHRWVTGELREVMDFRGAVFSDDLTMEGAAALGEVPDRARAALEAGCDMLPICNDRPGAMRVVDALGDFGSPISQIRLARMHGAAAPDRRALIASDEWQDAHHALLTSMNQPQLRLDT